MKKNVCWILAGLVFFLSAGLEESAAYSKQNSDLELGIDVLVQDELEQLEGKRIGIVTNPTGVDQSLISIVDVLGQKENVNVTALFGPEHGVRGDAQAGEYVDYYVDEQSGLPVYSLYGETREPTEEMLEDVDVLIFDIQDAGSRFYTYIYTMANLLEAGAAYDKEIIVLDRPNPIGGKEVGGPIMDEDYTSFVGDYGLPTRHGMTIGELAGYFNEEYDIGADLTVIEMNHYERSDYFEQTGLQWVMPSPNMPSEQTAVVYPGTTLLEGTNVSEGRGTAKPFELLGAPYINSAELASTLNELQLPGVIFRPASFTPTFSKHEGELSHGVEVHVTDRSAYEPVAAGVHIVKTIHDLYPEDFAFLEEDADGISFFDRLAGSGELRHSIEKGDSVEQMEKQWEKDRKAFEDVRRNYLLYQ